MNRRNFLQRLLMTPAILPFIPKVLGEPEVKQPEVERQPNQVFSASSVMSASSAAFFIRSTTSSNAQTWIIPIGNYSDLP